MVVRQNVAYEMSQGELCVHPVLVVYCGKWRETTISPHGFCNCGSSVLSVRLTFHKHFAGLRGGFAGLRGGFPHDGGFCGLRTNGVFRRGLGDFRRRGKMVVVVLRLIIVLGGDLLLRENRLGGGDGRVAARFGGGFAGLRGFFAEDSLGGRGEIVFGLLVEARGTGGGGGRGGWGRKTNCFRLVDVCFSGGCMTL